MEKKQDMALNNQQWLICHKTQRNQTNQQMSKTPPLICETTF